MALSVLDIFKIGIGPRQFAHRGPMRAAARFVHWLADAGQLPATASVHLGLYGSLGATAKGHGRMGGRLACASRPAARCA